MADELYKRDWKGSDHEEPLKKEIKRLRYEQRWWTITKDNVVKILDCLMSGHIGEEEPFYLGEEMWASDKSFARILAVFSSQAPTISVRTGKKVITIARIGSDDPNLKIVDKKRVIPYVPFYERGLLDAADMWDAILRTHSIRCIEPKKNKPGKLYDRQYDAGIIDGDTFVSFYDKLRSFAYSRETGAKRKNREDMGDKEIAQVEKAKVARQMVDSIGMMDW